MPFITINLKKGSIKKRIFSDSTTPSNSSDEDHEQDRISTTSKQSWSGKSGFRPFSTALTILMSAIYDAEKEKNA